MGLMREFLARLFSGVPIVVARLCIVRDSHVVYGLNFIFRHLVGISMS